MGAWRVVATQQGFYNQQLFEVGEVFDLLSYADGTYPHAVKYLPKKDAEGKVIADEFDEEPILGKDKKPVHRDFAEDQGDKLMRSGPKRGEVMRFGWMKRVPDSVPIGQYPVKDNLCTVDFWARGIQLPPAVQAKPLPGERGPENPKRNHARVLDVLPPPVTEAA